ncbi:MAG: helix-turn-helix transcriptional regulator [Actinomycetota bacterium]
MTRRRPAPFTDRPIHNRVARLRADRGLTRLELAEAVGVHYQTVGYIERGEYAPSLHVALRIAETLDLPVEVVFSTERFDERQIGT